MLNYLIIFFLRRVMISEFKRITDTFVNYLIFNFWLIGWIIILIFFFHFLSKIQRVEFLSFHNHIFIFDILLLLLLLFILFGWKFITPRVIFIILSVFIICICRCFYLIRHTCLLNLLFIYIKIKFFRIIN